MPLANALTPKQTLFVQEYLIDGCGAQAAIRCGSPPAGAHVWASRTLRIAKVSAALKARQQSDATRLSLSRNDVLAGLLVAVDQARVQANPAAMISGWREIGRLMGYYSPEVKKTGVATGARATLHKFESMHDAELLAILAAT